MTYLMQQKLIDLDPAVGADVVLAAKNWLTIDAPALERVAEFREYAETPMLAGIDYSDPKVAHAIGHHMLDASLNTHHMPDASPLRLNAFYYPAFKRETTIDEADNATVDKDLDTYPRHLLLTELLPFFESSKWRHPLASPPPGFGKHGDYICSAVMHLGCRLDRFAFIPFLLSDLNSSFLEYRCDLDTAGDDGVTIRRLGGGIADMRTWTGRREDIARLLDTDVAFENDTSDFSNIRMHFLTKQVQGHRVVEPLPLAAAHLVSGQLHLGKDLADGTDLWLPLDETTHTLVSGETGSGKSTWIVSLIEGLRAQGPAVEHLYLCDLKQVEFATYADTSDTITVVDDLPALFDVIDTVHAVMVDRLARAKASHKRNSEEPFIVLIIDEFANLTLMEPFLEGADKKRHKHAVNRLLDIGMRSRSANIRLVISLQHPIDKHIPSALKFNCPTKVLFRVPSRSYIALMFGDADEDLFPVHPRDLTPGQAYYQRPGHQPRLLQGTLPNPAPTPSRKPDAS